MCESSITTFGPVYFQLQAVQLLFTEIPEFNAISVDPDNMVQNVWSGSAWFANYPFLGFLTKKSYLSNASYQVLV